MRIVRAFILDLALTAVFVAIGMSSHGSSPADYPMTALPFIIALLAAWLVPAVRRAPSSLPSGAIVWVVTAGGGLGLRAIFGDGVSGAFPIVTAVVLAFFFFGWRLVSSRLRGRSHQTR